MKRLALVWIVAAISIAALACGGDSDVAEDTSATDSGADSGAQQTATAQAVETVMEEAEGDAAETADDMEADSASTEAVDSMESEPEHPEPVNAMARTTGQYDGYTFNVVEGSEATFTVEEQLASLDLPNDAVMRTSELSGTVAFDGSESVVIIELNTLSSDSQYRDGYVRNRMFSTHPVAKVTVPSTLPLPDGFAAGEEATTQVETMVSLLGSEFPLTFDIEARDDGESIFVVGRATFTWDQFGITKPTARSVVSIEDDVRVEVLLALEPASAP